MEWRRGCNVDNDKKKDSFTKKKKKENPQQYSRDRNDNHYSNRNSNYKSYNRRSDVLEKKEPDLSDENSYPVLESGMNNSLNSCKAPVYNYLEMCKEKEKEEKDKINLNDKKFWRGNVWIGPKFMKNVNSKSINRYLSRVLKENSSTVLIPTLGTRYSRNSFDWYNSWEECFSESEWNNMNSQLENEEWEESVNNLNSNINRLAEIYERESDEYYELTGRLDDYAEAVMDRIMYEKYLEHLEVEEIVDNEEDEDEEYYDYNSDE